VFKNNGRDVKQFRQGTGGQYLNFGDGTPTMLHGRERVMTEAEGRSESATRSAGWRTSSRYSRTQSRDQVRAFKQAMKSAKAFA
jgi:hypothetical protein